MNDILAHASIYNLFRSCTFLLEIRRDSLNGKSAQSVTAHAVIYFVMISRGIGG